MALSLTHYQYPVSLVQQLPQLFQFVILLLCRRCKSRCEPTRRRARRSPAPVASTAPPPRGGRPFQGLGELAADDEVVGLRRHQVLEYIDLLVTLAGQRVDGWQLLSQAGSCGWRVGGRVRRLRSLLEVLADSKCSFAFSADALTDGGSALATESSKASALSFSPAAARTRAFT